MSNPNNLPKLDGSLAWGDFKLAHFGPDTPTLLDHQGAEQDYNTESILVTIESHYWLEGNHKQDDREDVASWMSDWALYNAELDSEEDGEDDQMGLGEWLQCQFRGFVDEGFYRLAGEDFLVLASLSDAMAWLEVERT